MLARMPALPLTNILIIWLGGLAFAALHSGFATQRAKAWAHARGITSQRYRLIYSLLSLVLAAAWLLEVAALPDQPLYRISGPWRWLLHGLQLAGLYAFWLSLKPIDTAAFLGLRPFPHDVEPFIEQGIYRRVRHPMYAGIMLMLFAWPAQSFNSLNLFACISAYFAIGARFEERRLLAAHPGYADYRRRVPAFVPHWPKKS